MSDLILNPRTQRFVKIGGVSYRKAIKNGDIIPPSMKNVKPVEQPAHGLRPPLGGVGDGEADVRRTRTPTVEQPDPIEPIQHPEIEYDESRLQDKLSEMTKHTIKTNFDQLANENLTDKQVDALLKKLLFQKLCIDQPTDKLKVKPKKTKKVKTKTKSKRFKVITPPPSSSDQSESESD